MGLHKSESPFFLTVTDTHGRELWSFSGSLLKLLDVFSEANEFTAEPIDTYSRVRRELVASGGAYARYYKGAAGLPVLVQVVAETVQAPAEVRDAGPLDGGALAAAAAGEDAHRYGGGDWGNPAHVSSWGTSPVAAAADFVPVECASCKQSFLQNPEFGNRICAACYSGERGPFLPLTEADVAPVKNKCGKNIHPTLGCSQLSTWQRRNYGCTCGSRKARTPKPLTDGEYIEAKAAQLYAAAGLEMPKLPRKRRK